VASGSWRSSCFGKKSTWRQHMIVLFLLLPSIIIIVVLCFCCCGIGIFVVFVNVDLAAAFLILLMPWHCFCCCSSIVFVMPAVQVNSCFCSIPWAMFIFDIVFFHWQSLIIVFVFHFFIAQVDCFLPGAAVSEFLWVCFC